MNYYEIRINEEALGVYYKGWCTLNQDKSLTLDDVPDFVEDYALDVLAGRAKPLLIGTKQIGEGDVDNA